MTETKKPESTVRRTTISAMGSITETQIPVSSTKKEAFDISGGSPTILLLSREAAMQITEQAIAATLANTWSDLLKSKKSVREPPSRDDTEKKEDKDLIRTAELKKIEENVNILLNQTPKNSTE